MASNLISDENLKELFDKDIFSLIGAENLKPEEKDELYLKMAKTVENRALERIYNTLSEEEGQQFDQLLEQQDGVKINEFLKSKNLDVPSILIQEAVLFKRQMQALFEEKNGN